MKYTKEMLLKAKEGTVLFEVDPYNGKITKMILHDGSQSQETIEIGRISRFIVFALWDYAFPLFDNYWEARAYLLNKFCTNA